MPKEATAETTQTGGKVNQNFGLNKWQGYTKEEAELTSSQITHLFVQGCCNFDTYER